jgi:hypothetical protein
VISDKWQPKQQTNQVLESGLVEKLACLNGKDNAIVVEVWLAFANSLGRCTTGCHSRTVVLLRMD